MSKDSMLHWVSIMDRITGGAFSKNSREATAAERVAEWDGLTPEQTFTLRQRKGDEWVLKQGAEVEKLRRDIDMPRPPVPVEGAPQ